MLIPANWQDVLCKIRAVYPNAIIGGGALRDLHHGKPAKDIDIFIPVSIWAEVEVPFVVGYDASWGEIVAGTTPCDPAHIQWSTLASLFQCEVRLKFNSVYGRDGNLPRDVMAVYNVRINDETFEVIFVMQPEGTSTINWFDLSICQIGYDGSEVFTTEAFNQTLQDKTIRIMNVNRVDRQAKRMARMLTKYPEYKSEYSNGDGHTV